MESSKEPKTKQESASRKECLIRALTPLYDDFAWLNDLLTNLPLIESDFEMSGYARKIAYMLYHENPNIFDDIRTLPLKTFIIQLNSNVKILKNQVENLDKAIEEAYNTEARLTTSTKSHSKL